MEALALIYVVPFVVIELDEGRHLAQLWCKLGHGLQSGQDIFADRLKLRAEGSTGSICRSLCHLRRCIWYRIRYNWTSRLSQTGCREQNFDYSKKDRTDTVPFPPKEMSTVHIHGNHLEFSALSDPSLQNDRSKLAPTPHDIQHNRYHCHLPSLFSLGFDSPQPRPPNKHLHASAQSPTSSSELT